ncbi:MAG: hypothetical protein HOW73_42745 [Polyangiaceae bacterium]|nr:hypothetical protein [Polyangiaceae bacterium]
MAAIPTLGAACDSSETDGQDAPSSGGSGGAGGSGGSGAGTDGGGGAGAGDMGGGGSGGGEPVPVHVCSKEYPRIDLKADCGAAGDGMTNDTPALAKAVEIIQKAGGGELTIPPGIYIVGDQLENEPGGTAAYYEPIPMFKVHGLACLKISGYGATLRIKDGLRYGGFDPDSGLPGDFSGGPENAAHVGRIIEISESENVLIEGIELDGNCEKLELGGRWGDVDRQTAAAGIWINMCSEVTIRDVHTHHHALDGVTVLHLDGPAKTAKPHYLERVVSEYNGRQAISWIGGNGLYCTDCKFNHTGRAMNGGEPLMSAPRAGLDIEPNAGTDQQSRDGRFTRCEFVDNAGAGVLCAVGDGGYSTFDDCTIWGTTAYSMWLRQPGLKFVNCRIHGTAVHASDGSSEDDPNPNPDLATAFEDCLFEDVEWTDGTVFRNNNLYTVSSGAEGASFTRCTFKTHEVRSVYMDNEANAELFDSCTFEHGHAGLSNGTYHAYFRGSRIKSCHFTETAAVSNGASTYAISVASVTVEEADVPTHVDGPKVKWNSASATGTTGDIDPGTYD